MCFKLKSELCGTQNQNEVNGMEVAWDYYRLLKRAYYNKLVFSKDFSGGGTEAYIREVPSVMEMSQEILTLI